MTATNRNGVSYLQQRQDQERRRVERIQKQQKSAERMCKRTGRPYQLQFMDYRYWQCLSCGWNPEGVGVFLWFTDLHWRERETLLALSRQINAKGQRWLRTRRLIANCH